jgi:hypothetical protein
VKTVKKPALLAAKEPHTRQSVSRKKPKGTRASSKGTERAFVVLLTALFIGAAILIALLVVMVKS